MVSAEQELLGVGGVGYFRNKEDYSVMTDGYIDPEVARVQLEEDLQKLKGLRVGVKDLDHTSGIVNPGEVAADVEKYLQELGVSQDSVVGLEAHREQPRKKGTGFLHLCRNFLR